MKIVFYHACAFNKAPFCELMDEAERLHREGNEVYFVYCNGLMNCCASNLVGNRLDCNVCRLSAKKTFKLLNPNIHIVDLKKYETKENNTWNFNSAEELKHIQYENIPIGYSVMSTYISATRNLNPKIDENSCVFFSNILTQAAKLVDAFAVFINEVKPDKICVFNGRYFESSPIAQYALLHNIPIDIYEFIWDKRKILHKTIFQNHLAHNIPYITSAINNAWEKSTKSIEEREMIGKSFFENRRRGIEAADKVYIANQNKGEIPSDWDASKHNIVIFNSSEDEFAAVGDEYERYALYTSQLQGIKSILNMCRNEKDIHFYLRVHPNLSNITYNYHTDLYQLTNDFDNLTVIKATDTVSTYSLLDLADKVVVFGSTMGVEASYWGKPVVLLAGAIYYYLNVTHIPHSEEELHKMLIDKNLPVHNYDKTPHYKYAFYFLDIERALFPKSYEFFNFNHFTKKIGKKVFHGVYCQKLLGSSKLYAIHIAILRELSQIFLGKKSHIPLKEQ